ncbi:MAG: small multi-drug export protein [Desulfurococcales archaeon]|nr:small multi-drug export protein [Desulfurococcales archaeon]
MIDIYSIAASLKGIDPALATLLISLLPVIEPRYALVIGVTVYGMSVLNAFILSIIGLIFLSIILASAVEKILESGKHGLLSRVSLVRRLVLWIEESSLGRASPLIERYGWVGLVLFIAIPLPLTGVYTGTIAGLLLGIKRKKLLYALLLGGFISILITGLSVGVISMWW